MGSMQLSGLAAVRLKSLIALCYCRIYQTTQSVACKSLIFGQLNAGDADHCDQCSHAVVCLSHAYALQKMAEWIRVVFRVKTLVRWESQSPS